MRRVPLILVLLALAGVAALLWDDLGALWRGDASAVDDPYDDAAELVGGATLDEAAGRAPGLRGNPGAARGPRGDGDGEGADGGAKDGGGDATLVLEGGVPFKGKVVDANGRGVAEAKITLVRAGAVLTFVTDEDGAFEHGPQPGRWDLSVSAPGIGSLLRRNMMIDGANSDDLTFNLRKPGTLTVLLEGAKGSVEGVELSMTAKGFSADSLAAFEAVTDAEGRAVFEDLPGANYEIRAQVPEGPALLQTIGVWSNRTLRIKIPGGVQLTGQVTEGKDGPGVGNAIITVDVAPHRSNGTILQTEITTESDGKFAAFVPTGRVRALRVQAEGFAPWPNPQNWRERRDALRPLNAISRGKPAVTKIHMRSGASVRGTVTDDAGNGMACAFRVLGRRGTVVEASSNEDGSYAVPDLNPGRFWIAVVTPGLYPKDPLVFDVQGEAPTTYDFTLLGARRIQGVVLTAEGQPALGARVWLVGGGAQVNSAKRGGRPLETFSDERGRWMLADVPTDRSVTVRAAMASEEATPFGLSFKRPVPEAIKLTLAGTASVRVKVIDMVTRQPLENANLRLRPDGDPPGRTNRTARTNRNGIANLYRLIPGRWSFEGELRYYMKYEPKIVRLEASDDLVDVTIELDPGLVFAGVVVNEQNLPMRNVQVRVWGTDQDGKGVGRRTATTNQRGEFRLTGYARGAYVLDARTRNYKRLKLDGLPGGDDRLVLRMEPQAPKR